MQVLEQIQFMRFSIHAFVDVDRICLRHMVFVCACAVGEKAPDINFKSVADQRLENCGYMSEKSTAENFLCLHSLLGQYHAGMHSHFSMSETLFGISDY